MINQFNAYIKTISVFIIFSTFVRIIMPDNNFKAYINLILGVIIAGVILEPVIKIFNKNEFDFSDIIKEKEYVFENVDVIDNTDNMKDEIVYIVFKKKLDENIEHYLKDMFFEDADVNCTVDEKSGKILKINIKLEEVKEDKEIIENVSNTYGVSEKDIVIESQKN